MWRVHNWRNLGFNSCSLHFYRVRNFYNYSLLLLWIHFINYFQINSVFIVFSFVNVSTVLYGTKDIQNGEYVEGHTIKVKNAYPNTNYQAYGGYFNDIALVEVKIIYILLFLYEKVNIYSFTSVPGINTSMYLV